MIPRQGNEKLCSVFQHEGVKTPQMGLLRAMWALGLCWPAAIMILSYHFIPGLQSHNISLLLLIMIYLAGILLAGSWSSREQQSDN